MLPLCKPGHLLLAVRGGREPRPGDVVVIRHGGLEKVKRLTQVNGGHVFVEGDNQAHSTDSRSFGWLHRSAVQGRVVWPRPMTLRGWLRVGLGSLGVIGVGVCAWVVSL